MDELPFFLEDDEELMVYILQNNFGTKYHNPGKSCGEFVLDNLTDDFCWLHFRFYKADLFRLKAALKIPDELQCTNRITFSGIEGICLLLKRMIYPTRYVDMMKFFPRTRCEVSRIFNKMIYFVSEHHAHTLETLNHSWLSENNLKEYAKVLKSRGCPYLFCVGFLDGTIRPICRPTRNQREYYNGHKRVHSIKFQYLSLPNGLIAHLYGPVHGRRHDSYMLQKSRVIQEMEANFVSPQGVTYHVYGDPAYPLHPHLMTTFPAHTRTPARAKCNKRMSSIRVSVEWGFGKLVKHFAFLDFKKNLKIALQPVHNYYQVGAILINCHTCVYGSQTSLYFSCEPPSLELYLS